VSEYEFFPEGGSVLDRAQQEYAFFKFAPICEVLASKDGTLSQDATLSVYEQAMADPFMSLTCNSCEDITRLANNVLDYIQVRRMRELNDLQPKLANKPDVKEELYEVLSGYANGHLANMPLFRRNIDTNCREVLLQKGVELDDKELIEAAEDHETSPAKIVELLNRYVFGAPDNAEAIIAPRVEEELPEGYVIES
jgi:hypothetical protein